MKVANRPRVLAPRSGHVTYDLFCALVADGQKADLIDGVIYMASPDNTDANDLFMWLSGLLYDFAERYDLGKVYGSRVACRLDEKNAPEPDIVFVRKEHLDRVERRQIAGAGDLAVEIVSPESAERDYVKKRQLYERFGFDEYWIIDEDMELVTLYYRNGAGKFREIKPRKAALHSKVLPGFWLKPAWLWAKSRPRKSVALATILSRNA